MKLSRIDSNKICYILNQDDLANYNLTIKDLAYGNEKSRAFMNNLIEQLSSEINFNPEESNLSVELIPMENGELKIEVSALDKEDDWNILYSNMLKEYGDIEHGRLDVFIDDSLISPEDLEALAKLHANSSDDLPFLDSDNPSSDGLSFHGLDENESDANEIEGLPFHGSDTSKHQPFVDSSLDMPAGKKDISKLNAEDMNALSAIIRANVQESLKSENSTTFVQSFELDTLDCVIHISHIINKEGDVKSSLYKDAKNSSYVLLLETMKKDSSFKGVCNLIVENGGRPNHRYTMKSYCEEHLELMIKDNAMEQLRLI